MEKNNIQTRVVFTGNILRQPAFKNIKCIKKRVYRSADKIMKNSLLIACHHGLTMKEIKYIYLTIILSKLLLFNGICLILFQILVLKKCCGKKKMVTGKSLKKPGDLNKASAAQLFAGLQTIIR